METVSANAMLRSCPIAMRQTNRDLAACITSEISCLLQSNTDAFRIPRPCFARAAPASVSAVPRTSPKQEHYVQLAFQSRHSPPRPTGA